MKHGLFEKAHMDGKFMKFWFSDEKHKKATTSK